MTVILGLGSNLEDRLDNLRRAYQSIKKIPGLKINQVSPVYESDALLPENAPESWDMPHLNLAIRCEVSDEPLDLLKQLKNIEWSIGRKPEVRHWGPRIVDIDILAWGDRVIESDVLTVPHANLQTRPFALWPLADVDPFWQFPLPGNNQGKTAAEMVKIWGSRFTGEALLRTRQIYQRIDTPQLVGIVNVTPNSFSDGGKFLHAENAVQQALYLVQSGAEVLDIGAESTAPNSPPISNKEEWARLEPVLIALNEAKSSFSIPPKISVDTRHPDIAMKALNAGVHLINDVSGLNHPMMRDLIRERSIPCVVMHQLSLPASNQHVIPYAVNAVEEIYRWGERKLVELTEAGLNLDKIILDPGIGFGVHPEQSIALIKQIERFKQWGCRLMMGHSRKSFLALFTPLPAEERDIETSAITTYLANRSIDYLRVHQVEAAARTMRMTAALGM
jgi:2-amino-4-hydroxy-6-hydroxymethyldihydropteridine diphosphokinase/dihydropteroate synthase